MSTVTSDSAQGASAELPGVEKHAHARALLLPALPPGRPSHAYLFHGPRGSGKRAVARAFAGALLAHGAPDGARVQARVQRGVHPDLTWVRARGASEMLVADIDEAVVAAASRTPFEASSRVFVIEGAERMNEQAANRLLKTLEEPPPYAHLVLIAHDRHMVLPTIASRCLHVRFDARGRVEMASALVASGASTEQARSCAALALGDGDLAKWLSGPEGEALRKDAQELVASAVQRRMNEQPWKALMERARAEGERAGAAVKEETAAELERLPAKGRRARSREGTEAERRATRRARAERLDLGLRIVELCLRDCWCMALGAKGAVHAIDLQGELAKLVGHVHAGGGTVQVRASEPWPDAIELVVQARLGMLLNVSEELALEALGYRLERTLGREA